MSKCKTCFADILNSDWPIGPGYFVSAKDFETLREAVKAAEPPHEHFEGMNECPDCDRPFLLAAERLVSQQHREVEALRAALELCLDALIWCSGSYDFCPEGKAAEGWSKLGRPAITAAQAALAGKGGGK